MDMTIDYKRIAFNLTVYELEAYKDAAVLITGCNGFIGVWLCNFFDYINAEYGLNIDVVGVDVQLKANTNIVNVQYRYRNICDFVYSDTDKFDYIFNCAGIANPSSYMRDPIATLDVSYIGTHNILEYAKDNDVKSVVCFSSSEVYGSPEPEYIPTSEDHVGRIHTYSNRSCYDVGKLVLETLCYTYHDQYNVPVKVVRPFNLYGPFMDDTRVVPNFIRKVLAGEPLNVYGDGEQTRTFCYMIDAMVYLLKISVSGKNGQIYNVGTSSPEITMPELVTKLGEAAGMELDYKLIPYPEDYPGDEPRRRCPDISKVMNLTGYEPQIHISYGLRRTYNYFKEKYDTTV